MLTELHEEHFGILTDDQLYLDCMLIRAEGTADRDLRVIHVWVPKFPLTKSSTIVCARQEMAARGQVYREAHLVFDLRGSGESDGSADDTDYEVDLRSIKAWAEERFGAAVKLSFHGTPTSRFGRINLLPLRSGVVMESYYFPPHNAVADRPVLYLSAFGNFDHTDDIRCAALARSGFEVFGLDPLRYLLHASSHGPLTPDDLARDFETVADIVGRSPRLIGLPLGAGLALLWASLHPTAAGVIAIGQAQNAFQAAHLFSVEQKAHFDLAARIDAIAPRPLVLVWPENHPLAGTPKEQVTLFQRAGEPKRIEKAAEISPQFLENLLGWIAQKG